MSQADWQKLIERYADGRPICNCGEAYYTPKGDTFCCKYGCNIALLDAKEYIAERVLKELEAKDK